MLFFSYDIVLIVYFLCYAVVNVQLRLIAAWWLRPTAINGLGEVFPTSGGLKWTRTTAEMA